MVAQVLLAVLLTLPLGSCVRGSQPTESEQLAEQLQSGDVWARRYAVVALGKASADRSDALRSLLKALGDADAIVRRRAAESVADLIPDVTPAAATVVPRLTRALKDDADVLVRVHAARGLLFFRRDAGSAIPTLVEASAYPDPRLRGQAVLTLGEVGFARKDAVDALLRRVKDKDVGVRRVAVAALPVERMEYSDQVLPALFGALSGEQRPNGKGEGR